MTENKKIWTNGDDRRKRNKQPRARFRLFKWLVLAPVMTLLAAINSEWLLWLLAISLSLGAIGCVSIYVSRSSVWLWVLASVFLSAYLTLLGYVLILLAAPSG